MNGDSGHRPEPGDVTGPVPWDSGLLLARAHLLRMRGQWAEAAEQCGQVLEAEPDNATAHSLLGDICSDEGRLPEARHWYQLALELNPRSKADRAKLARTEEALEAREHHDEWRAVIEGRSRPPAAELAVRESFQRVGAVAGAAICGIILILAVVAVLADRARLSADPTAPEPGRLRRPVRVPVTFHTRREQLLLAELEQLTQMAPAVLPPGTGKVVDVSIDPRTQTTTLRVLLTRKARESRTTPAFREQVLRSAYGAAFQLQRASRELHEVGTAHRTIHVYVLGPSDADPAATSETLFVGTLAGDLVVPPHTITPDELMRHFGRAGTPFWSAELAVPG